MAAAIYAAIRRRFHYYAAITLLRMIRHDAVIFTLAELSLMPLLHIIIFMPPLIFFRHDASPFLCRYFAACHAYAFRSLMMASILFTRLLRACFAALTISLFFFFFFVFFFFFFAAAAAITLSAYFAALFHATFHDVSA